MKAIRIDSRDSYALKDLSITHENGHYYLNAEYIIDSKYHTGTLTIKDILLPIHYHPTLITHGSTINESPITTINLGFGELKVDIENIKYEIAKEKPQKLTLAEIEDKLGYKIELVSGKEQL